jgi:hypothetical protein
MIRPRWHDAAIVLAIAVVAAVGVWALWWDDVRGWLHPSDGSATAPQVDVSVPQT